MIGSIFFFGALILILSLIIMLFDRTKGTYSVEYYKYLQNNKVPPPQERDDDITVLMSSLWGGGKRR